jgi:hypothetical protein
VIRDLVNPPDLTAHTGFMMAEDEALKSYLTGISVPPVDGEGPEIPVQVWFRWPTSERQIKYPFITIDSIAAEPEYSLFHSEHLLNAHGLYRPSVAPTLPEPPGGWDQQNWAIRNFLPFNLVYQVSVFARSNLHDRYLRSIFVTDVIPPRPFWIACDVDQTWRRTELTGYASMDAPETSESGTKRIFRKIYTISMLAEVPQEKILDAYFYRVFRVFLSVKDRETLEEYFQIAHEGVEVPTEQPPGP